jgi:heme exporter protein A
MSASEQPPPLLRLSKLTRTFGIVTAVKDVDLEVSRGDFITIFGPNGAGKTTLLRMIASLTRPTRGELIFQPDSGKQSRKSIGYASHQSLLYNEMTAQENLEFYARLYVLPEGKRRVGQMLEKMGLGEARHQRVGGYSRGMKQRLTLARALLHEPQLLLLDEPYTGLDQHASRVLTGMLQKQKEEGTTILLMTHNLTEGLELCNRVIIQHRGQFVFQSRRGEVPREHFERLYCQAVGET